ncbi:hypothetical protein ZTR_10336 [Talaromyces verruculosus]|nr:hypothetical protein ZTR_10336 [Talaromyces verruculosus]
MYDPKAYNSLPSLRQAAERLDEDVRKYLFGEIRQMFLDNNVYEKYGISLLHKHFPIGEEDRLVDCRHTSTAWKVGDERDDMAKKYEGLITPRSFRLWGGLPVPYEFAFSPTMPMYDAKFEHRVFDLLRGLGLEGVFGLRYLDEYDPNLSMEITEGNANIMMPRGSVPDSSLIEALWVFSPRDDDRCHCREVCFKKSEGHENDHSCG